MQLQRTALVRKLAAALVFAGAYLAVLGFDYPGHLSYDSVVQLLEGRSGVYAGWHPPVMSWLLGLGDALVPGTGLFMAANAALLFASLVSIAWTRSRPSWAVLPAAILCAVLPQLLIYQGTIWKDVLFANACVAGFVCLAHAAECWKNPRARALLIGLACLLFVLATLTRQNGIIALVFAAVALGWTAYGRAGQRSVAMPLAYGFGIAAIVFLMALAGQSALDRRIAGDTGPGAQLTLLQLYDLAGALKAEPGHDLSDIRKIDPPLEALLRTKWAPRYSLREVDTIEDDFLGRRAADPAFAEAIRRQWIDLVLHDTGLYLRIRTAVFRWVFFTPGMNGAGPDKDVCLPYALGISGPDEEMHALGLTPRWTSTDDALDDYAAAFPGTPAMSHATYAGLALLMLAVFLRRRRPADIPMAAMLASALAFTASFFFISISCDYRYLYALDLSSLVAFLYFVADTDLRSLRPFAGRFRRPPAR